MVGVEIMKYKVVIVEDDSMVAAINRKFLSSFKEITVVGEFRNGLEAIEYLRKNPADLIILDYYMPVMDGRDLILTCHDEKIHLDFIMITAANQADDISDIFHLGVVDYLVKPFTRKRFDIAIGRYLELKERMQCTSGQMEILEKGLQKETLERIRRFLQENREEEFTSNQVASMVGLSRITVRRYMNYLLTKDEIVSRVDYCTGGRPAIKYRMH